MTFARLSRSAGARWVLVGAALVIAASAQAQTVYRIVGPDGKVSFSDQPPPSAAKSAAPVATAGTADAGGGGGNARLPFELRKVVGQFPVVLYVSKECAPCNSGRNLLVARGIPFTEKSVDNNESIDALKPLSGQTSLPLLTIGSQQLKGYSDANWSQYLTAAGYPEKSVLPSGYSRAPATPVAQAKEAKPAAPAAAKNNAAPAPAPAPETPVTPAANNPAGIRF